VNKRGRDVLGVRREVQAPTREMGR